jgi:hypothetical protein
MIDPGKEPVTRSVTDLTEADDPAPMPDPNRVLVQLDEDGVRQEAQAHPHTTLVGVRRMHPRRKP